MKETIKVISVQQQSGAKGAYLVVTTETEKLACYDTGSFSDFQPGAILSVEVVTSAKGTRYIKGSYGVTGGFASSPAPKVNDDKTTRSIMAQVAVKEACASYNAGKITKEDIQTHADWLMTTIMTLARDRTQEAK